MNPHSPGGPQAALPHLRVVPPPVAYLTQREREVLALIAEGRTNRQIAQDLTISLATAARHVHNILTKLEAANRTEAVARARTILLETPALSLPAADSDDLDGIDPYPGLRAFSADDAARYFGRQEVVAELVDRLRSSGMVAIVGASGSGKSSLIRAGILPSIRSGGSEQRGDVQCAVLTPGAEPLVSLAAAVSEIHGLSPVATLRELESDPRALDLLLRQVLSAHGEDSRVVLAVDQFEELFTLCRDQKERERFVDQLCHPIGMADSRIALVIALRADVYGECAALPGFARMLAANTALLGPMTREELLSAIEGPAIADGACLEPGLSERILADLGDAPGALPLLAHALRETWLRRDGRMLTVEGYEESGGIRGAIAATAEDVFAECSEAEQAACRHLFLRLTEIREGFDDTRRRLRFDEVDRGGHQDVDIRLLIQRFAVARLLTIQEDWVEVAHEALIREWPRLRGWLDDDREGHRTWRHLTDAAGAWQKLGRDEGELYRGLRLAAAADWVNRSQPQLNSTERQFLDASLELEQRERLSAARRLRRLRGLVSAFALVAAIAIGVGALALVLWNESNSSRARAEAQRTIAQAAVIEATISRLETEIPIVLKTDRSLAFLLAAEAHRLQPGPRTSSLLNLVLGDDPRYLGRIWASEPQLSGYAASPDGKYIATITQSGLLELREADSRHVVANARLGQTGINSPMQFWRDGTALMVGISEPTSQRALVVSLAVPSLAEERRLEYTGAARAFVSNLLPDGRMAVAVNGAVTVLNLADGSQTPLPQLPQSTGWLALDPHGRYITVQYAGAPLRVGVFDASTSELLRTIPQFATVAAPSVFTEDGNLLVVSYGPGSDPGKVELWNPETGELLASNSSQQTAGTPGLYPGRGLTAFPDPSGSMAVRSLSNLATVGQPFRMVSGSYPVPSFVKDGPLYNWEITGPLEKWDLKGQGLASRQVFGSGGESAISPDGTWMVMQASDGSWSRWRLPELTLIDRSTGTPGPPTLPAPASGQLAPAISGDGRYFATSHSTCAGSAQQCASAVVVVWDSVSGKPIGEPVAVPGIEGGVRNPAKLAFHSDLPLLAIASQNNLVQVVRIQDGAVRKETSFTVANTSGNVVSGLAFLPRSVASSPTLVTLAGGVLSVYEVGDGGARQIRTYEGRGTFRALAVNGAGEIALGLVSGELMLYDYASLAPEALLPPKTNIPLVLPVGGGFTGGSAIAFSANGKFLSVRTSAGKVAVWDIEARQPIGSSFASFGNATALLAPDGSFVVVTNEKGTVAWDLDTAKWFDVVCQAAGRNLSEGEWQKYFPSLPYESACPEWPEKPQL